MVHIDKMIRLLYLSVILLRVVLQNHYRLEYLKIFEILTRMANRKRKVLVFAILIPYVDPSRNLLMEMPKLIDSRAYI